MKEILIKSPKYGDRYALVDDSDFELVSKHTWSLDKYRSRVYVCTRIKQYVGRSKKVRLHRFLIGVNGKHVDHIDGNGLNNQRANLRVCTQQQNNWNMTKVLSKTGYKGVTYHKTSKFFYASIHLNNKRINLGCSKDVLLCAKLYNEAAIKYFGEFACINPIPA